MPELNISHFNGLELTYIDLIVNIETGVYLGADYKNMHICQFSSKELWSTQFNPWSPELRNDDN